ncbi:ABC-1 domain protein [Ferroglobus placidus DSM 10642]|uniref:ABC-1 domain protein n=1 Tax=Ferroglobus placidus (strain DSM 10642 / AEDII12DO) TaxID=589924 RepID=D3RZV2_FERPA|nr:AarF/UbiB family protein [Ferroglobus placidus]ADC66015.1 ABC-1 domain protein [Ferroglobus placidus DSM 10642]
MLGEVWSRVAEISLKLPVLLHVLNLPPEVAGKELKFIFESLGATFIKLGQLLSYHPFPEEIRRELQKLMFEVEPFDESLAEKIVKEEIGEDLKLKRISTASISQIHLDEFGRIVKVMKPELEKEIYIDLEILKTLEGFVFNDLLRETIRMLIESLPQEIDFEKEAENIEEMSFLSLKVPEVYEFSKRVIVMERLEGVSLVNCDLDASRRKDVFLKLLKAVDESVRAGKIHGDPSPANVIVGEEVGLVDFGLVWKAKAGEKRVINELYDSLLLGDFSAVEEIINAEMLEKGEVKVSYDFNTISEALFSDNNLIEKAIYGSKGVKVKRSYLVFVRAVFQWLKLCREVLGKVPDENLLISII